MSFFNRISDKRIAGLWLRSGLRLPRQLRSGLGFLSPRTHEESICGTSSTPLTLNPDPDPDPDANPNWRIGGTYMTLLNTVANLGGERVVMTRMAMTRTLMTRIAYYFA